ncbi:MAG: tetratricopeptide repeat protein, partial [Gammaproteobacteria bacterium]|nr:tetratricopeptide repeat protein [Gammaproteobacteria bacterium]
EALVKNGEYPKAIEILTLAHRHYPDSSDISLTLLDALFKNGQTEKDFNWEIDPCILYLDEKTKIYCAKYLKYRRKNRTLLDIYGDLMMYNCYLKFSEIELFNYLKESDRFMILDDDLKDFHEIEFKNKRN